MGERLDKSIKTVHAISKVAFDFFLGNIMGGLTRALINTAVCLVLMIISFLLGAWWF